MELEDESYETVEMANASAASDQPTLDDGNTTTIRAVKRVRESAHGHRASYARVTIEDLLDHDEVDALSDPVYVTTPRDVKRIRIASSGRQDSPMKRPGNSDDYDDSSANESLRLAVTRTSPRVPSSRLSKHTLDLQTASTPPLNREASSYYSTLTASSMLSIAKEETRKVLPALGSTIYQHFTSKLTANGGSLKSDCDSSDSDSDEAANLPAKCSPVSTISRYGSSPSTTIAGGSSPRNALAGCTEPYTHSQHLKSQKRTHKEMYPCPLAASFYCWGLFNTAEIALLHSSTHKASTPMAHQCPFRGCTESFAMKHALDRHFRVHEMGLRVTDAGSSEPLLPCRFEGCTRLFTSKKGLANHSFTHERFKCPSRSTCWRKSFATAEALSDHAKTHEGQARVFICRVPGCKLEFSTRGLLVRHCNTHEKKFPCPHAESTSCRSYLLTREGAIQHGAMHARTLVCEVCHGTYGFGKSLNKHMKVCRTKELERQAVEDSPSRSPTRNLARRSESIVETIEEQL